jgi:hypothetical protein
MDSTIQDQLNALRRRLTALNSQFREVDNRLTEANIQTDIWNMLKPSRFSKQSLSLKKKQIH